VAVWSFPMTAMTRDVGDSGDVQSLLLE